jgi:hypothetical protein
MLSHFACSTTPKTSVSASIAGNAPPRRVAVLPFANRTSNPEAATVLRRMFYNFFSSLNYVDIEPAVVDSCLEANGMLDRVEAGSLPNTERLGQLLGVDAVVVGEALSLGQTYALVYANQEAGLRARMIRCATGEVMWQTEHTVTLHEGDLPLSLPGLAAAILKTAITFQQTHLMRAASELCMQATATIPNPPAAEQPPKIQALAHNAAGTLLAPGEELKVVMVGDRHLKASFSLPPLLEGYPMEEREPGVYVATYTVQPGDRLADGRLVGFLHRTPGAGRQWVDTLGPIRVGAPKVLPPIIDTDTVLAAAQGPYVVEDALVVAPGAVLTVEAGVVVWFRRLGLVVRGTLRACGTAEQPVIFSGITSRGWKGVFLEGGREEHLLRHCRISGAEYGIRSTRARSLIEDCRFQENTWGVVAEDGQTVIRGSWVRASVKTGVAARNSRLCVKGSVIAENAAGGFLLEGSPAVIEGNNIVNNGGWGIKALGPPAEVHAGGNWWGQAEPDLSDVIKGPVTAPSPLPAPVNAEAAARTPN